MGFDESKQVRWGDRKKDEECESMESWEASSSSSSLSDDAASSSTSPSRGPLDELVDLLAQLPIKRGLSKYYNGKSQSHASLASVSSVEDLAKYNKRMKPCKSYGSNLNRHKFGPKPTITKEH